MTDIVRRLRVQGDHSRTQLHVPAEVRHSLETHRQKNINITSRKRVTTNDQQDFRFRPVESKPSPTAKHTGSPVFEPDAACLSCVIHSYTHLEVLQPIRFTDSVKSFNTNTKMQSAGLAEQRSNFSPTAFRNVWSHCFFRK